MKNTQDLILEDTNPVLTELGAALYTCQIFENDLCLILTLLGETPDKSKFKSFPVSWDHFSEKTLGNLVRRFCETFNMPKDDNYSAYLWKAVEARNTIVHGFLTNRVQELSTPKGRVDLINELIDLNNLVRERYESLNSMFVTLMEAHGLDLEKEKKIIQNSWTWNNFYNRDDGTRKKH